MNGKNIIVGLNFVSDGIVEEAEYGVFPVSIGNSHRRFRRSFVLAAIIGLLMLLVGCAAYFYSLKQLIVIDHSNEVVVEVQEHGEETLPVGTTETFPETTSGAFVAENILSLQGYEGSPAYHALQEWLAFAAEYTMQNPGLLFSSDFQRPEAYTKYPCYSQEMVDKVDEICSKYGLHLLGGSQFIVDAAQMDANGLSGVLSDGISPRCFYGHLYQDRSFVASGELEFSGDYEKTVQFKMHHIKKDAFYTVHLGLNNMSDFSQWNHITPDGYTALLALNDKTGLIFVENEGRFISIIIEEVPDSNMVFSGLPNEKHFLELVCDCFVFGDLKIE